MAASAIYGDAAAFGFHAFSDDNTAETCRSVQTGLNNEDSCIVHSATDTSNSSTQAQCTYVREDFVVIAEFSEVTGPIPILTVPLRISCDKDLDIDNFIMKIMSVDYQANPSGHFQPCEDVQVLTSEAGLHAYVHYTMLHDLQARGWVRPICIAYISTEHGKIQRNFDLFRSMFQRVAQIMKHDNCHWFMGEILKVLEALKLSQGNYFSYKKKEIDGFSLSDVEKAALKNIDMDSIVHQYSEYKHLLHSVEPLLDDKKIKMVIDSWKEGLVLSEQCIPQVASYLTHVRFEMDSSNKTNTEEIGLKSFPALCPWALSCTIWSLLSIIKAQSDSKLVNLLSLFASEENTLEQIKSMVNSAVTSNEYHNLLSAVTQPLEVYILDNASSDLNSTNHMLCSANEATASGSYHSAPESLSELPVDIDQSSDNESFLDISETFQTDDSGSETDDHDDRTCIWDWRENQDCYSNCRLLKFFRSFDKVATHVMYSLMSGRTLVIFGSEAMSRKVSRLVSTLSKLIPATDHHPLRKLVWHCGILVSSHISNNQLIGLCVPERLSIHDMINSKDKNNVTTLDIETKLLFGPAYSGHLLSSLDKVVPHIYDDKSLLLYLLSVAAAVNERLFVYQVAVLEGSGDMNKTLKDIRLQGCDLEIIKYFTKLRS